MDDKYKELDLVERIMLGGGSLALGAFTDVLLNHSYVNPQYDQGVTIVAGVTVVSAAATLYWNRCRDASFKKKQDTYVNNVISHSSFVVGLLGSYFL